MRQQQIYQIIYLLLLNFFLFNQVQSNTTISNICPINNFIICNKAEIIVAASRLPPSIYYNDKDDNELKKILDYNLSKNSDNACTCAMGANEVRKT